MLATNLRFHKSSFTENKKFTYAIFLSIFLYLSNRVFSPSITFEWLYFVFYQLLNHFSLKTMEAEYSVALQKFFYIYLQRTWNFSFSIDNVQLTIPKLYFLYFAPRTDIYLLLVACTFSSSLQSTLNSDTSQAQSLVNSGELAPAETAWDRAPSSNNGPL